MDAHGPKSTGRCWLVGATSVARMEGCMDHAVRAGADGFVVSTAHQAFVEQKTGYANSTVLQAGVDLELFKPKANGRRRPWCITDDWTATEVFSPRAMLAQKARLDGLEVDVVFVGEGDLIASLTALAEANARSFTFTAPCRKANSPNFSGPVTWACSPCQNERCGRSPARSSVANTLPVDFLCLALTTKGIDWTALMMHGSVWCLRKTSTWTGWRC